MTEQPDPSAPTDPTTSQPTTSQPARPAADIVAELDLATKIRLLSGDGMWWVESLPDHGLDDVMVTDGPHGLRQQKSTGDHLGIAAAVESTCFPTAVTLGSTWDLDLVDRVGGAIAEEALEQGVSVVLGPGLNIKRHPAGGRSFEYFSEDPLLSGRLAAAFVRGVQAHGIGTSIKHFAVNNQESYRFVVDAVVDERTLREIYLTGFEIAVKESAPWTVMCSYNLVNGVQASEHPELLTTILRDEWGFDGLVMSDWGACSDRVAGVSAGLDLEMPGSQGAFDAELTAAVADGSLPEADVDRCATRVVELLQRGQRGSSSLTSGALTSDRDAHHQLGRTAAAAGSVLLSNNGVLPLRAEGRIAVIGASAETPRYQGAGSSQVTPTRLDTALAALRERVGDAATVAYAPGYVPNTGETTDELFETALRTAQGADVIVVFAGLPAPFESEGFDRPNLDIPAAQTRLIEALAATSSPVVVVLHNGGLVQVPWADRVDAVLECWLGGQAGGSATVDVLFGDAEPGGRLPESIPEHVAQLPADRNFPGQPRQVEYREGLYVGYRFHDSAGVAAKFPFGHGLSYTTFEWSEPELAGGSDSSDGSSGTDVEVRLTVTNTGDRAGSDVVQVYVRDVESSVYRPDKELKGFAKVHLEPGASTEVRVPLDRRSFAVWDVAAHDWLVEAGDFQVVVARSAADVVATLTHHVDSADQLAPATAPRDFVADDEEFTAMLGRPVPTVAPSRPFHRNSTLGDIESTKVGRVIASQIVREGLKRSAQEFPDPDEATLKMVERALKEGPVRALVLLSGGLVTFPMVDSALDALNGDWSDVAGRVRRLGSDRLSGSRPRGGTGS